MNRRVAEGRKFSEYDIQTIAKVAVIGTTVKEEPHEYTFITVKEEPMDYTHTTVKEDAHDYTCVTVKEEPQDYTCSDVKAEPQVYTSTDDETMNSKPSQGGITWQNYKCNTTERNKVDKNTCIKCQTSDFCTHYELPLKITFSYSHR